MKRTILAAGQLNLSKWSQKVADDLAELLNAYSEEDSIYDYVSDEDMSILGEAHDVLMDCAHFLEDMYR